MSDDIFDPEEEEKSRKAAIEKAASELYLKFDSVQIIATSLDTQTGEAALHHTGRGNFYARTGSVRTWLVMDDQWDRDTSKRQERRDEEE